MSAIIAGILAVAKSIPVVDSWVQALSVAYTLNQISKMKNENKAAVIRAVSQLDQRDIEKALGSETAGQLSGIAGTQVVDTLPGVPKQ